MSIRKNISSLFTGFIILIVIVGIMVSLFYMLFVDKTNRTNFKIYSSDKTQCVTIITKSETRYIINGKHDFIPETNFIKIDISDIDPIGDEIGVCWKKNKYEWEIVNHQAKVIENRLDTTKFKFNTNWENDERGIPNCLKYHQTNCGTLGISGMKIYKNKGMILEN